MDQVEGRISQQLKQYDIDDLTRLALEGRNGNFVTIDPVVIRDALIHHPMK